MIQFYNLNDIYIHVYIHIIMQYKYAFKTKSNTLY